MGKNAAEFLAGLSRDPNLRQQFKKDPDGATAGLSAADRAVLRSGDPDRIRKYLGGGEPTGCCIITFL